MQDDWYLVVRFLSKKECYFKDKIRLPQSIFEDCLTREIQYPMVFHFVETPYYFGVLDFTADEGTCYVPDHMKDIFSENDFITLRNVSLPKMEKIGVMIHQPETMTHHLNLRSLIEDELKRYSCLWTNKRIRLNDNLEMTIIKLEPASVVCAIETDAVLELEFEPLKKKEQYSNIGNKYSTKSKYKVFSGQGNTM